MVLATTHDEMTLASFMAQEIGAAMAAHLAWVVGPDDAGSYEKPVNEALRLYGADAIGDVSDVRKLERLATYAVWSAVVDELVVSDFSTVIGGVVMTRSQRIQNAERRLARAQAACLKFNDFVAGEATALRFVPIEHSDRFSGTSATTELEA